MARDPAVWEIFPFLLTLVSLAVLPSAAHSLWERRGFRAAWAIVLAAPVVILALSRGAGPDVLHSAHDYVDFIALLGTLYVISGGVLVTGRLEGTPVVNSILLLLGSLLASFLGTAGASMLFIRPYLHANRRRKRVAHGLVLFIILVGNVGGCLLPIGDPPLYLGFLRGVPFFWTLTLWPEWLLMVVVLIGIFFFWDRRLFLREGFAHEEDAHSLERLRVTGLVNFPILIAAIAAAAMLRGALRPLGLVACAGLSWYLTPKGLHEKHGFTFEPIEEIVFVFFAIFGTIVPALELLEHHASTVGIHTPRQFFWATGLFSAFLDNAPTYLTAFSLAKGFGQGGIAGVPEHLLRGISLGAVFFGALTYVGNGPNFLVRGVAKARKVEMPGFFGYMAVAGAILLPLLAFVSWALL
jgi:Na+/H+ antiporter NhaD/arsenite permease-like protein